MAKRKTQQTCREKKGSRLTFHFADGSYANFFPCPGCEDLPYNEIYWIGQLGRYYERAVKPYLKVLLELGHDEDLCCYVQRLMYECFLTGVLYSNSPQGKGGSQSKIPSGDPKPKPKPSDNTMATRKQRAEWGPWYLELWRKLHRDCKPGKIVLELQFRISNEQKILVSEDTIKRELKRQGIDYKNPLAKKPK